MSSRKVLVVGCGGREHAIIKALVEGGSEVYCIGTWTNPGIYSLIGNDRYRCFKKMPVQAVVDFAKECTVDYAVIGPEKPLQQGIVNTLLTVGIPAIGPTKELAQIETSKGFARQLMPEYSPDFIEDLYPTVSNEGLSYFEAEITHNEDYTKMLKFIAKHGVDGVVLKQDGLAGGKGVMVGGVDFTNTGFLEEHFYWQRGKYVIEERLHGHEFSLFSFCDGDNLRHMPPVQDFKRGQCGDQGPNTGGMGSISPPPFLTEADIAQAARINVIAIERLFQKYPDQKYIGILYGSFMKCDNGEIKLIEFNARFGDPEAINIVALLHSDLGEIFESMLDGTLVSQQIIWEESASVCKYLVPNGYQAGRKSNQMSGYPLLVPEDADHDNIVYAGLNKFPGKNSPHVYTTGSRALAVVYTADTIQMAALLCNQTLEKICGERTGFYFREDIGPPRINYVDAGVDVAAGNEAVNKMKEYVESTHNDLVQTGGYGSFGGIMRVAPDTDLVASTDGVGTKSMLVTDLFGHEQGLEMLGHDLVNHCVNDILVEGAYPLFFLDYYAAAKIDPAHVTAFVKGLSEACRATGTALLGGETAEMPGVYQESREDLVGTIVGRRELRFSGVRKGDYVMALPSVSPHTNGFSLIRKIKDRLSEDILRTCCKSHRCYLEDVDKIVTAEVDIHALCHITGGGLVHNPPRVLPEGLEIEQTTKSEFRKYEVPQIYHEIQYASGMTDIEMNETFNMGAGMMVFVSAEDAMKIHETCDDSFLYGIVV